jgi:hypothetical protein
MRARHRHFNSRGAGANLVLDARRITGLSNNDPVATWSDISGGGNDATQSTSGSRPTYISAQFSGQPAVRFTKTSSHFLTFAGALASGSTFGTAVYVMNIIGAADDLPGSGAPLGNWGSHNFANHWTWTDGNIYDGFGSTNRPNCGSLSNRNDNRVVTQVSATSLFTIWFNGSQFFTTASNTVGWSATPRLGRSIDNYWGGNLGYVAFLPSQASTPLRKRLEHAAAYSFKIACN